MIFSWACKTMLRILLIPKENRHTWNCPRFLVWIILSVCLIFSTHSSFSWNPGDLCNGNCMWHVFHTHGLINVKLTIPLFSISDFAWQPAVSLGCFLTDDCFCFPWEQKCFVTLDKVPVSAGVKCCSKYTKTNVELAQEILKGRKGPEDRPKDLEELGHFMGRISQIQFCGQALDGRQRWIHLDFLGHSHVLFLLPSKALDIFF